MIILYDKSFGKIEAAKFYGTLFLRLVRNKSRFTLNFELSFSYGSNIHSRGVFKTDSNI